MLRRARTTRRSASANCTLRDLSFPPRWTDQTPRVRELYFAADVFEKADKLVDKFRAKAESLADAVEPTEFRELLYYLVDSVLEKGELPRQAIPLLLELGR
jgi:hypothetical protein